MNTKECQTTAEGGAPLKAVGGDRDMYTTYVLQSHKTSRYYIGYTSDIRKRIKYHNQGCNKSTKAGIPWKLIYQEDFEYKKSAWLREKQIKSYKGGQAFKKLIG